MGELWDRLRETYREQPVDWQVKRGRSLRLDGEEVRACAFSGDGSLLAVTRGRSGAIGVVHTDDGRPSHYLTPTYTAVVTFDPGSGLLASTGEHKAILWNLEQDDCLEIRGDPELDKPCLAFAPSGFLLALGESGGVGERVAVSVLDLRGPQEVFRRPTTHDDHMKVHHLAFAPEGDLLAVVLGDRVYGGTWIEVEVWEVAAGTRLWTSGRLRDTRCAGLAFARGDEDLLLALVRMGAPNGVQRLGARTGEPGGEYDLQESWPYCLVGHEGLAVAGVGREVDLVELPGLTLLTSLQPPGKYGVHTLALSTDGKQLAVGRHGHLSLWDVETRTKLR